MESKARKKTNRNRKKDQRSKTIITRRGKRKKSRIKPKLCAEKKAKKTKKQRSEITHRNKNKNT